MNKKKMLLVLLISVAIFISAIGYICLVVGDESNNLPRATETPIIYDKPADYASNIEFKDITTVSGGAANEIVNAQMLLSAYRRYPSVDDLRQHLSFSDDNFSMCARAVNGESHAFPPAVVNMINGYLFSQDSKFYSQNISGTDWGALEFMVTQHHQPILVWVTEGYAMPQFSNEVQDGIAFYSNQTCAILKDVVDDSVLLDDPVSGQIKMSVHDFLTVWEPCGKLAVAIYQRS